MIYHFQQAICFLSKNMKLMMRRLLMRKKNIKTKNQARLGLANPPTGFS
jgi:hypothetical protein